MPPENKLYILIIYIYIMSTKNTQKPIQTFVIAAEKRSGIIYGEKYSAGYNIEGMGDIRVAFFYKIIRNLSKQDIIMFIKGIQLASEQYNDQYMLLDLIIIIFNTRDIRGGKGERQIFYIMLLETYKLFPQTIIKLLSLIPLYGYYKDYFNILEIIYTDYKQHKYKWLTEEIFDLVSNQLSKDFSEYLSAKDANRIPQISLLAKYIPKENKHFDKQYKFVDKFIKRFLLKNTTIYSLELLEREKLLNESRKTYRYQVSTLNKALNTVEILMSAQKFSEINFSKVSSKSIFKYRKAFLNEILYGIDERRLDQDRRIGRKNFIDAINKQKISGARLEIYEIVKIVLNQKNISSDESNLLQVQWNKIKEEIVMQINSNKVSQTFVSGNLLPIINVNGSMIDIPMYVAISMGILLSELNSDPIRNKLISFSKNPNWINIPDNIGIVEKINYVKNVSSEVGANFEAVYEMIIDIIIDNKLSRDQWPNLIIFSDMQFDRAIDKQQYITHHEKIKKKFNAIQISLNNREYSMPTIIYWNLRANTLDYPVQSEEIDVQLLSGFSPNLFKHILTGQDLSKFVNLTPYETLRNILDGDRYNLVREIVYLCDEIKIKIEKLNI